MTTVTAHPAKWSDPLLAYIAGPLNNFQRSMKRKIDVLDVFAGTGKIHQLGTEDIRTVGVELEPEWARIHPLTIQANALQLPFADRSFDAIVVSPTYGNRMADAHEAKDDSRRITYRHSLGRPLHPENSGQLHFGKRNQRYETFHRKAWTEATRVLRPGSLFVLNVGNFIRGGEEMKVAQWHRACLESLGFRCESETIVPTQKMGFGANGGRRVHGEYVYVMRLAESS